MTDALTAARDRLEAYCKAMGLPTPHPDPERDQLMVSRMIRDIIVAARIEAVESWRTGRPF